MSFLQFMLRVRMTGAVQIPLSGLCLSIFVFGLLCCPCRFLSCVVFPSLHFMLESFLYVADFISWKLLLVLKENATSANQPKTPRLSIPTRLLLTFLSIVALFLHQTMLRSKSLCDSIYSVVFICKKMWETFTN